jgi:Sec-independent protein translocase protein TatA
MLDNLGLGEFFFLALLALVFFGPERLPQIGARLGRWIRSLTQYSSAFLNEWRDEALAVHDAVQEVKGIRDEIVAARSEIAGTLETARTDLGDAVSGARLDVQQQVQRSTQILPDNAASAAVPGAPDEAGEDAAIARTREILDRLPAKRGPTGEAPQTASRHTAAQDEWQSPAPHPQPARRPRTAPVRTADVDALREQVASLQEDMHALRADLAQFRVEVQPPASTEATPATEQERAPAEPALKTDPKTEPIGEPA